MSNKCNYKFVLIVIVILMFFHIFHGITVLDTNSIRWGYLVTDVIFVIFYLALFTVFYITKKLPDDDLISNSKLIRNLKLTYELIKTTWGRYVDRIKNTCW